MTNDNNDNNGTPPKIKIRNARTFYFPLKRLYLTLSNTIPTFNGLEK